MGPRGEDIFQHAQCVHELAAACQRFVGGITIVEPNAFVTAVRRLVAELPTPQGDAESVFVWNAVSSNVIRGAAAHHQLFHRFFGGACLFAPLWLGAPVSFATGSVNEMLLFWAQGFADGFDDTHQWPAAVRAAALLQQHPLAVWYVADLAKSVGTGYATLERSFRHFYSLTPQRYHALLRVARTAETLRIDDGSTEGVVVSAGWPSVDAFARAFRALTGLRVSAIRRCTDEEFADILRGPLALPVPHQPQQ